MSSDSRGFEYSVDPKASVVELLNSRRGTRLYCAANLKAAIEGFYPKFQQEVQGKSADIIPFVAKSAESTQTSQTEPHVGQNGEPEMIVTVPEGTTTLDPEVSRRQLEYIYKHTNDQRAA